MKNDVYSNLGLIVAIGENGEIGCDNHLPWQIKEDLEFFKNTTMNSYIIMGRKTYESMPKKLKGRTYIVLSKSPTLHLKPGQIHHSDASETLNMVKTSPDAFFWVIGGSSIYKEFLPYVSLMHITHIEKSYPEADAYFPKFNDSMWEEIGEGEFETEELKYSRVLYKRR